MAIFQHLTRYLVVELESDRGESEHIYGCGGRFRSRLSCTRVPSGVQADRTGWKNPSH